MLWNSIFKSLMKHMRTPRNVLSMCFMPEWMPHPYPYFSQERRNYQITASFVVLCTGIHTTPSVPVFPVSSLSMIIQAWKVLMHPGFIPKCQTRIRDCKPCTVTECLQLICTCKSGLRLCGLRILVSFDFDCKWMHTLCSFVRHEPRLSYLPHQLSSSNVFLFFLNVFFVFLSPEEQSRWLFL